jgi:Iron-containing redox enzyme
MSSISHSGILWHKLGMAEGRLEAASYRFWTHSDLRALFPRFLLELHSTMRCGLALMATVRDCAAGRTDAVAVQTAQYLTRHIEEELHHDEWLLEDMAALGIDGRSALHRPPSMAVASLVGAQYCWAFRAHPVALLGYLAVLEGRPPLLEQLQDIQDRTGFPDDGFRCLREHADKDLAHIAELNDTLDMMPLQPEHQTLIAKSAFHTIDALGCLFEGLLEVHEASGEVVQALP